MLKPRAASRTAISSQDSPQRLITDLGVTHIDTAEAYGPFLNEELVGKALAGWRVAHLEENVAADGITLTTDVLARLDALTPATGDRRPAGQGPHGHDRP